MIGRRSARLIPLLMLLAIAGPLHGQVPEDTESPDSVRERLRTLSDPTEAAGTGKKDIIKPAFEFYRGQVAPFDVLPYVKDHHWSTLSLEMKANHFDFEGQIRTAAVQLSGMRHAAAFRRDVRLLKGRQASVSLQMMLPTFASSLNLELHRPEAIRPDAVWDVKLLRLEPHQMLIPVLGQEALSYVIWGQKFQAFRHLGREERDLQVADFQRYYRLVVAQKPDQPLLSPHPLTWTSISHILWDGQSPEKLSGGQQQALLDWLHWGGQLILMGGAGSNLQLLQDSFLNPYLPADPSGENALLTAADLAPLSEAFRAPEGFPRDQLPDEVAENEGDLSSSSSDREDRLSDTIEPLPQKPLYLEGLRPREGATTIPLGPSDARLLAVEKRVGRGRVMIVATRLTDPAFTRWAGLDTLVRRVVLRRPDDVVAPGRRRFLDGSELSWLRYVARDLSAPARPRFASPGLPGVPGQPGENPQPAASVAAWLDDAEVPRQAREVLSDASGISIPDDQFVLKVLLAYGIALVPLNYAVCRFLMGRREWAWIVVPVLAMGFAIAVERAAAYDLGFDSACDQLDLLEIQGGYSRAHLSRFAAVYSTGRVRYAVSYPGDPTAVALPMGSDQGLRGQELEQSDWVSAPVPELAGLPVQPRSLSMLRSERLVDLGGRVDLLGESGDLRVANRSDLELRDAVLIDVDAQREFRLGTIRPGETVEVPAIAQPVGVEENGSETIAWARAGDLLKSLKTYRFFAATGQPNPEDAGSYRLVAWMPDGLPGQSIQPTPDRQRDLTLVVAHLRYGATPSPFEPLYDSAQVPPPAPSPAPEATPFFPRPGQPRRAPRLR
jgi:hypothetical protein